MKQDNNKPKMKCACQRLKGKIRKYYFVKSAVHPQDTKRCHCGLKS